MSHLYILDSNPLSVALFANTFSHSIGCLLVLSVVSFAEQKLLSLIRPHLFTFAFILFFKNFFVFFIYLFMAALGLHCCAWAFSSCGERGLLFVAVHGLLIAVASLVAEHGL